MKVLKKIVAYILMVCGSLLMTPIVLAIVGSVLLFIIGAALFLTALNLQED